MVIYWNQAENEKGRQNLGNSFSCSSVRCEWQRDELTFSLQTCFPSWFYLFPHPPSHPLGLSFFVNHPTWCAVHKENCQKYLLLDIFTGMIFYIQNTIKEGKTCRCCWYMKTKAKCDISTLLSVTSTLKLTAQRG